MATRAQALADITSIVDWPASPPPSSDGKPVPQSFREWLTIFGGIRCWLYISGYVDVVCGLHTMNDREVKLADHRNALSYIGGKRGIVDTSMPESWKLSNGSGVDYSHLRDAQITLAARAGFKPMRYDKACAALVCLDFAARDVRPGFNIFDVVSLEPVTYHLWVDQPARYFLQGGRPSDAAYRTLLKKFQRVWPTPQCPEFAHDRIVEAEEFLKGVVRGNLITYRNARIIVDAVRAARAGVAEVRSLGRQFDKPSLAYSELIVPRVDTAALPIPFDPHVKRAAG